MTIHLYSKYPRSVVSYNGPARDAVYRTLLQENSISPGVSQATMPTPYPVGTCVNCDQPNRVLKYARRTMCWTCACQQAAHQAARAARCAGHVFA